LPLIREKVIDDFITLLEKLSKKVPKVENASKLLRDRAY